MTTTRRLAAILTADVAGHGAVSHVATQLRTLMRRHVNQIDQSRLVHSMNQQFAGLSRDGCFATALVTTFFAPTNHLSLCNAGHPPPLLYRAATRQWSFLDQRCADVDLGGCGRAAGEHCKCEDRQFVRHGSDLPKPRSA